MSVAPLIWLLVFDAIICGVWWIATGVFGWDKKPERLVQVMIGLVILINVFIVVVWALGLLGYAPGNLMHGPYAR